ncbi:MAG: WD40 repeat domain-containing protein [Scytonema sp. CRU_2_7]|nr:WD40 repeat domain-containing protein [Scytonema sp. CRU_2_7]
MNSNIPVYMSFSPDSRLIATAGPKDDIIYLWDLRGNQLAKIKANQGGIQDISFSPDGNQLATVGNDGSVRIWQDISGKQLVEVKGYKEENSNMSLSSDGQTLVISDSQGTLHLLSLNQNKQLDKLATNIPKISDINFSPDNQLLAIIREEGTIHLLDLQGKRQLSSFEGPDTSFGATGTFISQAYGQRLPGLSFSKDGNWLAIGGDKITLRKRDGQEVATFKIPVPEGVLNNWVQTTAFAPNSSLLATGGEDGLVRLWNLNTLQETQPLIRANTLQVRSIAFSPKENVLATAGLDGSIGVVRLWNLSGEQLAEFKGFQGSSPNGHF